ncbi:MAG TPA: hypothetical protein VMB81_26280 [Candidatus Sulfotelmatobacter sp.]|nr:hypothetical protein [Candidatus Sulfotelmatobacter sp.]
MPEDCFGYDLIRPMAGAATVGAAPLPDFRGTIPGTDIPEVGQPEDATASPFYHAEGDVDTAIERQPPNRYTDPGIRRYTIPQDRGPFDPPALPPDIDI